MAVETDVLRDVQIEVNEVGNLTSLNEVTSVVLNEDRAWNFLNNIQGDFNSLVTVGVFKNILNMFVCILKHFYDNI